MATDRSKDVRNAGADTLMPLVAPFVAAGVQHAELCSGMLLTDSTGSNDVDMS